MESFEKYREIGIENRESKFEDSEVVNAPSGRLISGNEKGPRPDHQDRVLIDLPNDAFGVIDGMGGYEGGGEAADLVSEILIDHIQKGDIEATNSEIQRRLNERKIESGACYALCQIEKKKLHVWSSGDCGVMVFGKNGELKFNFFGKLNDAPMWNSRGGVEKWTHGDLMNYDRILIASDGLWDNMLREDVFDHLKDVPVETAIKNLSSAAFEAMDGELRDGTFGNGDNISIILYEILPVPVREYSKIESI